jgi:hypothetical protein
LLPVQLFFLPLQLIFTFQFNFPDIF